MALVSASEHFLTRCLETRLRLDLNRERALDWEATTAPSPMPYYAELATTELLLLWPRLSRCWQAQATIRNPHSGGFWSVEFTFYGGFQLHTTC